jgi:hypothetical protein
MSSRSGAQGPPSNPALRQAIRRASAGDPLGLSQVLSAAREAMFMIRYSDRARRTFFAERTAHGLTLSVYTDEESFRLDHATGGSFAAIRAPQLVDVLKECGIAEVVIDPAGPATIRLSSNDLINAVTGASN